MDHSGNCATYEGHRALVLVVVVPEEHYEAALTTLTVVRSGMTTGQRCDDPELACMDYGPFEVSGPDRDLIFALGAENLGHNDPDSHKLGPEEVREHVLVAGVRALVQASK